MNPRKTAILLQKLRGEATILRRLYANPDLDATEWTHAEIVTQSYLDGVIAACAAWEAIDEAGLIDVAWQPDDAVFEAARGRPAAQAEETPEADEDEEDDGPFAALATPGPWTVAGDGRRLRVLAWLEAAPTPNGPRIVEDHADSPGKRLFVAVDVRADACDVATMEDLIALLADRVREGKLNANTLRAELRAAVMLAAS